MNAYCGGRYSCSAFGLLDVVLEYACVALTCEPPRRAAGSAASQRHPCLIGTHLRLADKLAASRAAQDAASDSIRRRPGGRSGASSIHCPHRSDDRSETTPSRLISY